MDNFENPQEPLTRTYIVSSRGYMLLKPNMGMHKSEQRQPSAGMSQNNQGGGCSVRKLPPTPRSVESVNVVNKCWSVNGFGNECHMLRRNKRG